MSPGLVVSARGSAIWRMLCRDSWGRVVVADAVIAVTTPAEAESTVSVRQQSELEPTCTTPKNKILKSETHQSKLGGPPSFGECAKGAYQRGSTNTGPRPAKRANKRSARLSEPTWERKQVGRMTIAPDRIFRGESVPRERRTSKAFVERKAGWTASVIESVTDLYCHSVEMVGKKDKLVFIVPQV